MHRPEPHELRPRQPGDQPEDARLVLCVSTIPERVSTIRRRAGRGIDRAVLTAQIAASHLVPVFATFEAGDAHRTDVARLKRVFAEAATYCIGD